MPAMLPSCQRLQFGAQHALEHLAGWIARQAVADDQLLWNLEAGELCAAVIGEIRQFQRGSVPKHHDRHRSFTPAVIRYADNRYFAHLRQFVDDAFDLRGGDVLAAGYDHVLLAIGQIEKAVRVKIADIAGAEPVAEEGRRGFLWVFPVALRDLRPAQADFAILARRQAIAGIVTDLDLDMGDGAAGRTDFLDLATGFHKSVAAAAFGQSIGVDVAGISKIIREGADARLRRLLAAADRPAQAGYIVAVAAGAGEDRRGHHRREPRRVELFRLDRGQRRFGLKIAVDREHAAMPEHGDAGQVERADMVEWPDHQQSRVRVQPQHQRLVGRFPVDVLVA